MIYYNFLAALVETGHPSFGNWDPSIKGGYRLSPLDATPQFVESVCRRDLPRFATMSRAGLVIMGKMDWRAEHA